jgi:serine protease Do
MNKTKIAALALSLILILPLMLGSGCGWLPATDVSPSPGSYLDSGGIVPVSDNGAGLLMASNPETSYSTADVVTYVMPSVVAINTQVTTRGFGNRAFTQEGAGSGWIIDEGGVIVTNNHVVSGAESISVTLDDGRTFSVDMNTLATDPLTDLAVFEIDAENLPAADIGDSSELRVGDGVIALGNSLGLGISATSGIVSGLGISLPVSSGQTLGYLIQTDAAINAGNSGGPLVNMQGEVIGINSLKIASAGVEGMGYAISINQAIPVIEELIRSD